MLKSPEDMSMRYHAAAARGGRIFDLILDARELWTVIEMFPHLNYFHSRSNTSLELGKEEIRIM